MFLSMKRLLLLGTIGTALGMSLIPNTTQAYSYLNRHWSYGNPAYVPVTVDLSVPSAWSLAIARGMSAWNNAGAKYRFLAGFAGHTVRFRTLNDYPTALAVTWVYEPSGSITGDRDTDINARFSWDVNADPNKYDVQSVMAHEFGHWLTLGDLYNSSDSWKTMYGIGAPGATYQRTLEPDDANGIRAIYGTM